MIHTSHMACRMQQRGLSKVAVELTLELGDWNDRGDQVTIGTDTLTDYIRRERRRLEEAERLCRRGGATVVLAGDTLITTYDRSRRSRV